MNELLFAGDADLVAHSWATLQTIINNMTMTCDLFSVTVSINKAVLLELGVTSHACLKLNGNLLQSLDIG